MDAVFAKSSGQSSKKKLMEKKKEKKKILASNVSNNLSNWQKDQNISVLATSNLLKEAKDLIEEDREEEYGPTSRAELDMLT